MFDLVFAKAQYFIFSFGNENIFIDHFLVSQLKLINLLLLKSNQKYDLDKFESIHGTQIKTLLHYSN